MPKLKLVLPLICLALLETIAPRARIMADVNSPESLRRLQQKLLDLSEEANAIQAKADAEKRELSDDERKEIDTILAEFDRVDEDLQRRARMANQTARLDSGGGRQTTPDGDGDDGGSQQVSGPRGGPAYQLPAQNRGKWGWRNMGEFAAAVCAAGMKGAEPDKRLLNAPTTSGNESSGADGGYAVPPDFRTEIMKKVQGEDSLLARTDQMQVTGNAISFPRDETTPWGSTGIQVYWEGEGKQLSQSKPALELTQMRLNKLTALVPMTDELLEDAPAMESYLQSKVPEVFVAKMNTAIVAGSGAGQPRGILNGGDLITVAKESGQSADTIVYNNITKMWSRLYAPARSRAVWLINQDIEQQLFSMVAPGALIPAYLPPGGLSASPYGTLMGRPVIPVEACPTLGDAGDIVLSDLSRYLTILKTGGMRTDVSIHLWFDYDTTAFRFIFRMAGQPHYSAPITPQNGPNTRSHNVVLAERA